MTLDSGSGEEEFVTVKGVDSKTMSDITLHPGMYQGQNEFALVENRNGLHEIKRIKLVPGKKEFPELRQFRAAYQKTQVVKEEADEDTMIVYRVVEDRTQKESVVEKIVYTEEFLEMLP